MSAASEKPSARFAVPDRALLLFVSLIAVLIYLRSAWFSFVYDDQYQVLDDPIVRSLHNLPSYFAHSVRWTGYYRPVFTTWFGLNFAVFGTHPAGWHLLLVLLNAVAVALVFLVVRALTSDRRAAFIAALLFAVHPTHIESVAWVSGASDVLLATFSLAAFLFYLRAFEATRQRALWIGLSLIALLLALGSKEPAATFPLVVLTHALLFTEGRLAGKLRSAIFYAAPYVVVTIGYLAVRKFVVAAVVPIRSHVDVSTMLLTLPSVLWFYISKLFAPAAISVFYDLRYVTGATPWRVVGATFALLCVLLVVIVWAKRVPEQRRLILFATAWFVITLAPALYLRSFESNELVHVRYLYLPSFGFCLLIGVVLARWIADGPRWRLEAVGGALVVLAVLTFLQQAYWADDFALYSRAVEVAPQHTTALNNLARVYIDRGQLDRAEPILRRVQKVDPDYGHGLVEYNLGSIAYREGRYAEAEHDLRKAVALNAGDSFYHLYLGLTLFHEQHLAEAEMEIRQAISLTPSRPGYHLALSGVLQAKGDLRGALEEARMEEAAVPNERVEQLVQALEKQVGDIK